MTKPTLKQTALIALMTLVGILAAGGGGMLGARLILEHAKSHPQKPASHAMGAAASPTWLDPLLGKIVALNGTPVPNEPEMNFISPMNVIDNPGNGSSDIYAPDGGGGGGGGGSGLAWVQQNYEDSTTNVISDTTHHIYVPILNAVVGQGIQLPEPTVNGQMVLIAYADTSGRGSHAVSIQATGGSTAIDAIGNDFTFENVGPTGFGIFSSILLLSSTDVGGNEYWKVMSLAGCGDLLAPYANRPQANGLLSGMRFLSSDGSTEFVLDPSTPAWRPLIGGTLGTQPPVASTWTQFGSPTTFADAQGTIYLEDQTAALGLYGATQTASVPYARQEAAFSSIVQYANTSASAAGMVLTDGTKYIEFTQGGAPGQIEIYGWNTRTGGITSSVLTQPVAVDPSAVRYLGIGNDGTTRTYYVSPDGDTWEVMYSEAAGTFLTETHIGIVLHHVSGFPAPPPAMILRSWQ